MITIKIGNSFDLIKELPDKSIDCVMTSPPYWNLRDYNHPDQLGLEKTPEEYIKKLIDFFDNVKMKLKDTGNLFLNLGDTYSGSKVGNTNGVYADVVDKTKAYATTSSFKKNKGNLPTKCLCMLPQRFAWNMIECGWILRNEIIWHKKNHMPESVTDRLTKAHEIVYHFVKQGKYYYNLDAIREPHETQEKRPMGIIRSREWGYNGKYEGNKLHEDFGSPRTQRKHEVSQVVASNTNGKNPGDVWSIVTQPYPESHFATFPLELIRRPILAGCPENGNVLDPFAGSGTVGEFCRKNNRNAILFELNPDYKKLIEDRSLSNIVNLCEL